MLSSLSSIFSFCHLYHCSCRLHTYPHSKEYANLKWSWRCHRLNFVIFFTTILIILSSVIPPFSLFCHLSHHYFMILSSLSPLFWLFCHLCRPLLLIFIALVNLSITFWLLLTSSSELEFADRFVTVSWIGWIVEARRIGVAISPHPDLIWPILGVDCGSTGLPLAKIGWKSVANIKPSSWKQGSNRMVRAPHRGASGGKQKAGFKVHQIVSPMKTHQSKVHSWTEQSTQKNSSSEI